METKKCPLCKRELGKINTSKHHLSGVVKLNRILSCISFLTKPSLLKALFSKGYTRFSCLGLAKNLTPSNTRTILTTYLTPKSRGGKNSELVALHNICHQKIHSLYTTKELKNGLNTIENLLANEEMAKFIKWVAKKDSSFYQSNRLANRRKS